MRILLMGPPGAGKGTQATIVAEALAVPHISTGDIFRSNAARRSMLGLAAQKYMEAGEYVPDELTNDMVRNRLVEEDASDGFVLDGYPRTLDQVNRLDDMLAASSCALDHVIELTVDADAVIARLEARAGEQGRSDDIAAVIRRRQEVYTEQTRPLLDVYSSRGLLDSIDGMGAVEEVTERIRKALGA